MSTIKDVVSEFLTNTKEAVTPKPTKIGDKLREALKRPDVQKRLRQLRAMSYINKQSDTNTTINVGHHPEGTKSVWLYETLSTGHQVPIGSGIHLIPLGDLKPLPSS